MSRTEKRHRGRREVDETHRSVDGSWLHTGTRQDPWHPQRRVVDEDAVRNLAVLAERLAVIGRHRDQRRCRGLAERIDQPPDLTVGLGDFLTVADGGRAAAPCITVRCVRFEQVHPEEEALGAM